MQARNAWAALAADALAFAAICVFGDFDSLGTAWGIAVMGLPVVAAIALFVWGLSSSVDARRFDRLERGEVIVATWIVDADTWRERRAVRQVPGRQSAPRAPCSIGWASRRKGVRKSSSPTKRSSSAQAS